MADKERAWYIDRLGKIGIVEKAVNAVTKDGYTSNWTSVSQVKDVRMYAISRDNDVIIDQPTESWDSIPEQFHETILYRAIASGYKDPRNFELQTAQYFDNEYALGVKEAKKFASSNYASMGQIKPQEF
jgi:hypothetical protein